jgi:hypothetical protein
MGMSRGSERIAFKMRAGQSLYARSFAGKTTWSHGKMYESRCAGDCSNCDPLRPVVNELRKGQLVNWK